MRLHSVQGVAVAHFTAHPHIGADDIGIIVFLTLMVTLILVGFISDEIRR